MKNKTDTGVVLGKIGEWHTAYAYDPEYHCYFGFISIRETEGWSGLRMGIFGNTVDEINKDMERAIEAHYNGYA